MQKLACTLLCFGDLLQTNSTMQPRDKHQQRNKNIFPFLLLTYFLQFYKRIDQPRIDNTIFFIYLYHFKIKVTQITRDKAPTVFKEKKKINIDTLSC